MKKIAVISDIHANVKALERALDILDRESISDIFVCGDIVGYGDFPNECCDLVRNRGCRAVAGNHDRAVSGMTDMYSFTDKAVKKIVETQNIITTENLAWLRSLPLILEDEELQFVHSSLLKPEEWFYLVLGNVPDEGCFQDVSQNFPLLHDRICFVGHSHIPAIFCEMEDGNVDVIFPKEPYFLRNRRAFVDVGSVGLPREGQDHASLVIYDKEKRQIVFRQFSAGDI